jgi:hypothetical protein
MTKLSTRASKGDPIPSCIKDTLQYINRTKEDSNLKDVFLSVDIGKYGSKSFEGVNYNGHLHDLESFVERVYGNMNVTGWERSFEIITGKDHAGYIALVQQAIVARAKCVLFMGGGSFQQRTLELYKELHPDSKQPCIKVVKQCTNQYRPIQV